MEEVRSWDGVRCERQRVEGGDEGKDALGFYGVSF